MSVLVVDDDTAIRLVISTLLEEEGYTSVVVCRQRLL